MGQKWNFKIDLKDNNVFQTVEQEKGISIPYELTNIIREYNAASPEKYHYMLKTDEKIFGGFLSFNKDDDDNVFSALKCVRDKNLLPFGIDPFGNYICFDLIKNIVVFWDHETGESVSTEKNLKNFLDELY